MSFETELLQRRVDNLDRHLKETRILFAVLLARQPGAEALIGRQEIFDVGNMAVVKNDAGEDLLFRLMPKEQADKIPPGSQG